MPETNFELSLREAGNSWRALRRRRANPPVPNIGTRGHAPSRITTFQVSLEQAEQQCKAAASIGYESRALNLYYGLQQAGRAIAAASQALDNTSYVLNGHGLGITPKLGSSPVTDIGQVRLRREPSPRANPADAFTRVSQALGSDLPDEFSLSDIWPLLVEPNYARNAALVTPTYQPMTVYLSVHELSRSPSDDHRASPELPIPLRNSKQWPAVDEFLARYPSLAGSERPRWPPTPDTQWQLRWHLDRESNRHVLTDRLTTYRGHPMAFPTLTADRPRTVHPLMAWWVVLYALSMLTRYAPAEWTRLIDIDRTVQATAIEFVLDRAIDAIPDLVDEAIAWVAAQAIATNTSDDALPGHTGD